MSEAEMARGSTSGETRRRIQDVARELFAEHGYEKTSLRQISERLGITEAALHRHFETKEDILAGLLDAEAASPLAPVHLREVPEREGGEPACRLHLVCDACGRLAQESDARYCSRCGERLPRE